MAGVDKVLLWVVHKPLRLWPTAQKQFKVDKIVGPGNIYVATAKRMVFGSVGLDMVAGPVEILIICDGKTDPDWITMDLFPQAEHDENAQSILIAWDDDFLDSVYPGIYVATKNGA